MQRGRKTVTDRTPNQGVLSAFKCMVRLRLVDLTLLSGNDCFLLTMERDRSVASTAHNNFDLTSMDGDQTKRPALRPGVKKLFYCLTFKPSHSLDQNHLTHCNEVPCLHSNKVDACRRVVALPHLCKSPGWQVHIRYNIRESSGHIINFN